MFRDNIRSFNKHILNPFMSKLASFSRGPFAVIQHVGRRSGKPYATPIIVEPLENSFVIALTYGPEVDWYRNVRSAEHSTLLWHGTTYTLEQPEPIDREKALPVFPRLARLILRTLDIQHFVTMKCRQTSSVHTKEVTQ